MIKLIFRLLILAPIVIAIAATGAQFDAKDIENQTLRSLASAWNSFSKNVNEYVVENDDEVVDMSKQFAGESANAALNAISAAGNFVDNNRDEIQEFAENAGESFGEAISDK